MTQNTLPPAFMSQLANALRNASALEDMVRPMLEMLQLVTGMESTYLTQIDHQAGMQRVLFARNSRQLQIPEGLEVEWGDTLCKRAIDEGCAFTDDVASRWGDSGAARELGINAYASVPIVDRQGGVYGTLCAASTESASRSATAAQVLQIFSHLIGQQMERERLVHALHEANDALTASALTDALTGLPNRRALIAELQRRLVAREHGSLMVAFIDLDNFKSINDQHGHDAGDRFLVAMAQALSEASGGTDFCARLGGDEFVCLGAALAADDCDRACSTWQDRLHQATRRHVELGRGVGIDYPGASVGVICAPIDVDSPDAVLSMADAAMYAVKQLRNQHSAERNLPRFRASLQD